MHTSNGTCIWLINGKRPFLFCFVCPWLPFFKISILISSSKKDLWIFTNWLWRFCYDLYCSCHAFQLTAQQQAEFQWLSFDFLFISFESKFRVSMGIISTVYFLCFYLYLSKYCEYNSGMHQELIMKAWCANRQCTQFKLSPASIQVSCKNIIQLNGRRANPTLLSFFHTKCSSYERFKYIYLQNL